MVKNKTAIQLSDHFTYKKLFRFVTPSIVMMIFTSLFCSIDDGLFVSNFVGKDAFVAINIMMPVPTVLMAISYMLSFGGSALTAKLLGEKEEEKASKCFSNVVYFSIVSSFILTAIAFALLKPYCRLMGADGVIYRHCVKYAAVAFPATLAFMLQAIFQNFLITAEKPTFAMLLTIASGACNILFDILFIVLLDMGIIGAACATISGPILSSVIPFAYFLSTKKTNIHLVKAKINLREIGKASYMGISQLISNLSMGLVTMVFNYQLMKFAGEDGVAANGVIMYLGYVFVSLFIGYSSGVAPIVGYHLGAQNTDELKNLYKKSMLLIAIFSVLLTAVAILTATPFSMIFVSYDKALLKMTVRAYRIYGISFLFAGFGIFASAFFTALNDGFIAGAISFIRTIVFQIGTVVLMPLVWGLDGVWFAPVVAEILATAVALWCCFAKRKKYGYA